MAKNLLQPSPISVKHLIQFLGGPFPGSMPSLATLYLTQHFQVVCALVGVDGRFYWTGAGGFDPWYAPHSVGTPFAPVGANVALALLPYSVPNNQPAVGIIIAVVIGNDGRLQSLWSDGKKDQQGFPAPAAIGTPFSQPGGGVALAEQNGTVTAVAIGNDGKLYAASVDTSGTWKAPTAILGNPVAPAGACIALQTQTSSTLAVAFIGIDHRLYVASVTGNNVSSPMPVGAPFAPPGAHVALYPQTGSILTAAVIGDDGRLWVASVTGTGAWTAPQGIGQQVAPPGSHLALGKPTPNILTCMFVGNDQRLWAASVTGTGAWNAATPISSFPFANAGAAVGLVPQFQLSPNLGPNRLAGVTLGNDGQLYISIVTGTSTFTDPTALPLTNSVTTGTVRPKYQVLSILYAPPGTNGGKSTSVADYSNSSSTGTSNSISTSFKKTLNVSVNLGLGLGTSGDGGKTSPVTLGASASYSASKTTNDTSSIQITKTQTYDLKNYGPGADGINHDEDQILIWLNPMVNIDIDGWGNIQWGVSVDGEEMILQRVYVGQLKNPSTMPADLLKQLTDAGLTDIDFQNIVDLNPFAFGDVPVDQGRYTPLGMSFPYNPPLNATDTVPLTTFTRMDVTASSTASTVTTEYDVSVTISAGFNLIFTASATVGGMFAWTNSATSGTTSGATHSSSISIGGPAYGYVSPRGAYPDVLIYWDTVYNTFLCAFATAAPMLEGDLSKSDGSAAPHQLVHLTSGSQTYSTVTDAAGSFRFYDAPGEQGTLQAGEASTKVMLGNPQQRAKLVLP